MTTFRPLETTPRFTRKASRRRCRSPIFSPGAVLESTVAVRTFEVDVKSAGRPADGLCAGRTERTDSSTARIARSAACRSSSAGHLEGRAARASMCSRSASIFSGRASTARSFSHERRGPAARRLAGRTDRPTLRDRRLRKSRHRVRLFAQDCWRVNGRLSLELGLRFYCDGVSERVNYSPRVGWP